MEKVPEILNSGTIFFPVNRKFPERCSVTFRNIVPEIFRFTERCSGIPEYSGISFRKISGLRNGNWKFSGLRYVNRKNFRFTKWKLEIFRFTLRKPEKFPGYEIETGNFPVSIP